MKKGLRISLYIIFGVIFLTSMLVIDYSVAKITGNAPIVAIKKENTREQYTLYTGIFYKMWICTAEENNYKVGSLKSNPIICPKKIEFFNNVYTTFNNIKITQKNYAMISDYYTYDLMNEWTSEEELNTALFISEESHSKKFATKEGYYTSYNNENYMIAMFEDFVEDSDGKWSWKVMEDDISYHYCIKYNDDKTKYMISKYTGDTCQGDFAELTYSDEWCALASENKVSDIIKSEATEHCK